MNWSTINMDLQLNYKANLIVKDLIVMNKKVIQLA